MENIVLSLIVLGVVLLGAVFYYNRKSDSLDIDNDGDIDKDDAKAAFKNAEKGAKEDIAEAVEKVKKALPTKSKLTAMKKAEIEKVGKDFGIDLDRRKTKVNMIKDLQKHANLNKH